MAQRALQQAVEQPVEAHPDSQTEAHQSCAAEEAQTDVDHGPDSVSFVKEETSDDGLFA